MCLCEWICSHDCLCVVCFGGIICHLASKYRGHMVGKQMSLVRPANAKSSKWRQEKPTLSQPKQTTLPLSPVPSWPCASVLVAFNDGAGDLGIKAYPSVALGDSPSGKKCWMDEYNISLGIRGKFKKCGSVGKTLMDCDGIYGLASKLDNLKDNRKQIQKIDWISMSVPTVLKPVAFKYQ